MRLTNPSFAVAGIVLLAAAVVVPCLLQAGEVTPTSGYSLLSPIRSGNLIVFPVVASKSYDTGEFRTLDEGLRSGDVVVTEAGQTRGLIRPRPGDPPTIHPIHDAQAVSYTHLDVYKRQPSYCSRTIVGSFRYQSQS